MTMHYSHSTFLALWGGLALTIVATVSAHLGRELRPPRP